MREIAIPKKLHPIVQAFCAHSPDAARALIIQSAKAIYGSDEDLDALSSFNRKNHHITEEELESICLLMQGLKPQDMLETLLAAQIVVSHMLGLRKLAKGYNDDVRIGSKLLQLSLDAMQQLQRKRGGGVQNISVSYTYNGVQPLSSPAIPVNAQECISCQ